MDINDIETRKKNRLAIKNSMDYDIPGRFHPVVPQFVPKFDPQKNLVAPSLHSVERKYDNRRANEYIGVTVNPEYFLIFIKKKQIKAKK